MAGVALALIWLLQQLVRSQLNSTVTLTNYSSSCHRQGGFFVREREWRAAAIHQGRIVGKVNDQLAVEADRNAVSLLRSKTTPKRWVTWWADKE